jgi:hypothetical protein
LSIFILSKEFKNRLVQGDKKPRPKGPRLVLNDIKRVRRAECILSDSREFGQRRKLINDPEMKNIIFSKHKKHSSIST